MPKEYSRTQRIADLIQRELALLLQREIKDPRLGMVTISAVNVSRDLAHAKIYITALQEDDQIKATLQILNKAANYLRHQLANKVELRTTPQLKFVHDVSLSQANKLTALIDTALATDQARFGDQAK